MVYIWMYVFSKPGLLQNVRIFLLYLNEAGNSEDHFPAPQLGCLSVDRGPEQKKEDENGEKLGETPTNVLLRVR